MRILAILSLLCIALNVNSQSWKFVSEDKVTHKAQLEREIIPSEYEVVRLNKDFLDQKIAVFDTDANATVKMFLPLPNGKMEAFEVRPSHVLPENLAAKYPDIKTFKGYSLDNSLNNARISISSNAVRATIRTIEGDVYIDPYGNDEKEYHISYYIKNDASTNAIKELGCGLIADPDETHNHMEDISEDQLYKSLKNPSVPVDLRIYRLALACTGEWGGDHGSTAQILDLMVQTVDRANLIFENELSIVMQLVENNDLLIFTDGDTDPYTNFNDCGGLLSQNPAIVNNAIGANSYDLGHILTYCSDVGGIARLGAICQSYKASGATAFYGQSVNNGVIGTLTHEIGHQMNGNHTMNNCSNSGAAGNENPGTGYEVGSGSTIMSYSGACGPDNTGDNFDRYHVSTLQEIYLYTRNGGAGDCAVKEDIGNMSPESSLSYEDDFFIPISTPFILTGEATDPNNDDLTFAWEQYNIGPLSNTGQPIANAPIFKTRALTTDKTRFFPQISTVINNGLDIRELLPTYSRDMTFRFIARDNNPGGGTADWSEVEFFATQDAGPFRVTSPNTAMTFEVGQVIDVTWDVANTDGDLVNCQKVSIYLSTNAGLMGENDLYTLASNVANDGLQTVTIPNTPADYTRIIVRADDNIFYDMSNQDCNIVAPAEPGYFMDVFPKSVVVCTPEIVSLEIQNEGFQGFADPVTYDIVSGLPTGATVNFSSNSVDPNENITVDIDLSGVTGSGSTVLVLQSTAGGMVQTQEVILEYTGSDFSAFQLTTPIENALGLTSLPTFEWTSIIDATSYDIEVATNPSFAEETIVLSETGLANNTYTIPSLLEKNTLYFWRVKPNNKCKEGDYTATRAFGTETLNCAIGSAENLPINISQSGAPEIEANISISSTGTVQDVVLTNIQGLHDKVSDLEVFVVSPAGTEVKVLNNRCGVNTNYNVGFNDAAATTYQCPLVGGSVYIPEEPLSVFIGENAQGVWKIRISDTKPGNGGTLDNAELEICSNASLAPPSLINNNVLQLPPNSGQRVTFDNLLSEDTDNVASELNYTVVQAPMSGNMYLDGTVLSVGAQFTQQDINDQKIRYRNDIDDSVTSDFFTFTVTDGNGGWIGITRFDIEIDASFTSSTSDISEVSGIDIFPNPANSLVTVNFEEFNTSVALQVMDINGKTVISKTLDAKSNSIDISQLSTGVYLFQIEQDNRRYQQRVLKID